MKWMSSKILCSPLERCFLKIHQTTHSTVKVILLWRLWMEICLILTKFTFHHKGHENSFLLLIIRMIFSNITMEKNCSVWGWWTHVLGIVKGFVVKTRSQYTLTLWWRETEKKLSLNKSHLDWTFSIPKWCYLWHYSDIGKCMCWTQSQGLNTLQWVPVTFPWGEKTIDVPTVNHSTKKSILKQERRAWDIISQSPRTRKPFHFLDLGLTLANTEA